MRTRTFLTGTLQGMTIPFDFIGRPGLKRTIEGTWAIDAYPRPKDVVLTTGTIVRHSIQPNGSFLALPNGKREMSDAEWTEYAATRFSKLKRFSDVVFAK